MCKSKGKIFCIGFHKTGTKSLAYALQHLGYKTIGSVEVQNPNIGKNIDQIIKKYVPHYEAFHDNPWPIIFRELDKSYPESKFIFSHRGEKEWIASVANYFGYKSTPMREWIYGIGSPIGHEDIFLKRFRQHKEEVMEYFLGREQDLLVMNICDGDGWDMLCPFLSKPVPDMPFPHRNKFSDAATQT